MSVYWIGRTKVHNPHGLSAYAELVQEASAIYKPEPLARGGSYKIIEGEDVFDRYALLRFTSMEHALTYYNSPEYQAALAHRKAATSNSQLVFVEGLP